MLIADADQGRVQLVAFNQVVGALLRHQSPNHSALIRPIQSSINWMTIIFDCHKNGSIRTIPLMMQLTWNINHMNGINNETKAGQLRVVIHAPSKKHRKHKKRQGKMAELCGIIMRNEGGNGRWGGLPFQMAFKIGWEWPGVAGP